MWLEVIASVRADGRPVPDDVIADMHERRRLGIDRYGVPLTRGDGRDHGVDAYQEALDLCAYVTSQWGAASVTAREVRRLVVAMRRELLAPCGACGSLRAIGSTVCSRCGATC